MHNTHSILGFALALVVACGDPNVPELATDGGSDDIRLDGVYSVPVSEPSLEPFASQPVVVDWRETNGRYRMDYDFPSDLTGVSQRVSFEGSLTGDGTIQLTGDLGSASCESDPLGTSFVCIERFPQLAFDLERLERDFERRGLPADEIAQRIEVARLFQSDPIGILSFAF